MKLSLLLLTVTLWFALPTHAQVEPPSSLYRAAGGVTVGEFQSDFRYHDAGTGVVYTFDQPLLTVMFSGGESSLSLSYGSTSAANDTTPSEETLGRSARLAEAVAHLGGNAFVFKALLNQPIALYVPIRLNFGYRYFSYTDAESDAILTHNDEPAPTLHLATAGFGAGLGGQVRLPTSLPLLEDNLSTAASWVMTYGVTGDAGNSFEQMGLSRALDVNIEIKLEKLLGSSLGGTVGYTHRTLRWQQDAPDGFDAILDLIQAGDEVFTHYHSQHMIRFGINW